MSVAARSAAGRYLRKAARRTTGSSLSAVFSSAALLVLCGAVVSPLLGLATRTWTGLTPLPAARQSRIPRSGVRTETLDRLVNEGAERDANRERLDQAAADRDAKIAAEEAAAPTPIIYQLPEVFRRLKRHNEADRPGHVVQRRWLRKGKQQGFVSVPFASAVASVLKPNADVNICLVGRRERSDQIAKAWQEQFDDLPLFDISGEASPQDLDPVEPNWKCSLNELTPEDEIRTQLQSTSVQARMEARFIRQPEEIAQRASGTGQWKGAEFHKILTQVVAGLPEDIVEDDDNIGLVRSTVLEMLKLLWTTYATTDATRLKWRFALTDNDIEPTEAQASIEAPYGLRSYLVLAGEGLEFIASQSIDAEKVQVATILSEVQMARMTGQDWAAIFAKDGTNLTEALKRVPAGWTTHFKGDRWPKVEIDEDEDDDDEEEEEEMAPPMHRLPQSGRRLFIEVTVEDPPKQKEQGTGAGEETGDGSEESSWGSFGPLAGAAAGLFALAKKSPPFVAGMKNRKKLQSMMRGIQKQPEPDALVRADEAMQRLEQRNWRADFGPADEAPAVLVVGGQSPTGRVVCQKLIMRGYHVTLLNEEAKNAALGLERAIRELPQGSTLSSAGVERNCKPTFIKNIPDDIYDAVSGIDKFIVVDCDDDAPQEVSLTCQGIKNILATWQLYRNDFAESQRSYTSKVQIFNFERDTDFEVWDLERKNPSDTCYGYQRAGWVRSSWGTPLFIGGFMEPVGQCTLACPKLKLNFKRFSGLIMNVYNQARDNKYSFFLRTSDFETSRIQYEYEFECEATKWHNVRMPFNAFKPIRCDGMELPEDSEEAQRPLDRADVVQMGVVVRTSGEQVDLAPGERLNPFSLQIHFIKVFRTQPEPQVVYVGRESGCSISEIEAKKEEEEEEEEMFFSGDDDFSKVYDDMQKAEAEAASEIEELVHWDEPLEEVDQEKDTQGTMEFFRGNAKDAAQAVVESGLAYTVLKVNGFNEHPGGKFPVSIKQASIKRTPLSVQSSFLGTVSRGDAAELAVSALMEPACVNAEMLVGEAPKGGSKCGLEEAQLIETSFDIESTMAEDVQNYLKQLKPNS